VFSTQKVTRRAMGFPLKPLFGGKPGGKYVCLKEIETERALLSTFDISNVSRVRDAATKTYGRSASYNLAYMARRSSRFACDNNQNSLADQERQARCVVISFTSLDGSRATMSRRGE
jgi:hypothetical protein